MGNVDYKETPHSRKKINLSKSPLWEAFFNRGWRWCGCNQRAEKGQSIGGKDERDWSKSNSDGQGSR